MPSFFDGHRLLLATSASAVVLLTACGGGGGGEAAPATTEAAATDAPVVSDAADPVAAAGDAADTAVAGPIPTTQEEADAMAAADHAASQPTEGGPEVVVQEGPDFTPALSESQPNASVDGRESAQALTVDSGDTGFAKPKVAAIDWVNDTTDDRARLLAKFKMVMLGARAGSTKFTSFVSNIKSKNAGTRIGYYTLPMELNCSESTSSYYAPAVRAANAAKFWVYKADGKTRAQWTTIYNHCDINVSRWGRKDSSGRSWAQYKAQFDWDTIYGKASQIEYVFSDNWMKAPRVDADWKRIGTNQSRSSSEIQSAFREGTVNFWNSLKAKKSSLKVMGNADGNLNEAEYVDRLHGAYLEGAYGKSWSLDTWAGWEAMMARYRAALTNTAAPNDVILQGYGTATDYKKVRYGLVSAMMENGWFTWLPTSGGYRAIWYDDFDAPMGNPTQSPPRAAWSNGVYRRDFQNGIALLNPTTSSKTVNVGTAYKRLKGTQDPGVNSGAAVNGSITLGPKSGILLIKR